MIEKKQLSGFIKTVIKFILFATVFYVLMIFIWGTYAPVNLLKNVITHRTKPSSSYIRLKEVENFKNIDILFLGSSHTYLGFDNRIFKEYNFTSFNLGTRGQSPLQTEILLNRYLSKLNPKIIVFEVNPLIFSLDGIESSIDIIPIDNNVSNMIPIALSQNNVKVYNTLLYRFYSNLIYKNAKVINPLNDYEHYISGGYLERDIAYYKPIDEGKNKWEFKENQFSTFERIISDINKKYPKIKVILVQAPFTKAYYNSYSNNEEFDKRISAYGEYYNFNKLIKLNDSLDFYDSKHMNLNGVKTFNKVFIETVLKR